MARATLTQLKVDRMRAPPERVEISDHLLPALRLIVQPSGARSWALRTRIHGKPAKITLGDARVIDLARARDMARDHLREIAVGADPRQAKRKAKATTLHGVAELYLRHTAGQVRPKTHVERERHLRRDWKPLHHRPLADIRKGEIAARLLEIMDEHGPIAANRSRTTLFTMFSWAVDQDLLEVNVVASVRRPVRREPRRDRALSLDELRQVWAATGSGSAHDAIIRLLMLTGARKSEVGGMRRSELDLDKTLWSLPAERTKNGLPHIVPLCRQALEIIRARPERGEYLFGARGAAPFGGWSASKRRLDRRLPGLPHWTVHDVRRSAVTGMNELGIATAVVELIVNHQSGVKAGVAGTYDRSQRMDERGRALQAWADHLLDVATPTNVVRMTA
jgi:integrase